MYWTLDDDPSELPLPTNVVDLLFAIDCRELPVDHAYLLSEALCGVLPWIGEDERIGIHEIHVAGSQNGWIRPAHGTDSLIRPSKRTKLAIRAPLERVQDLLDGLPGAVLRLSACSISIGAGKARSLSRETTLLARHVVGHWDEDEASFLARCAQELAGMEIRIRKAMCGIAEVIDRPDGPLLARSLLLAGLAPDESLRLQERGLGVGRLLGCGIFLPHKGIEAVASN